MAMFTDIHWGAKSNSDMHNQDCYDFITWFCNIVKSDNSIDAVGFLGGWNENRNALNIATLNWSYNGAKLLNDLGIPIFFIIGNHDLYNKNAREIHSVISFKEFSNFHIIEKPIVFHNNASGTDMLLCPFMFSNEYPSLTKYLNVPLWLGHFEFQGYEVTGYGMKMQTGPNATDFVGPKYILSGHFHKRQATDGDNVVYIGNAFPSSFGDAGDIHRGMATYDFHTESLTFEDWDDCPKYIKTTLSSLLDKKVTLYPNARVKCIVDVPVSFEESTVLRTKYTEDFNLREMTLEESSDLKEALSDTEIDDTYWDDTDNINSTDELVQKLLSGIESDKISTDMLVSIYSSLQPKTLT